MYVFWINIPFKGSQSLVKTMSKVTAVSYLHSGVVDSAVHVTAESSTSLKIGDYKVDFLDEYYNPY
jgi:hypothetical protein